MKLDKRSKKGLKHFYGASCWPNFLTLKSKKNVSKKKKINEGNVVIKNWSVQKVDDVTTRCSATRQKRRKRRSTQKIVRQSEPIFPIEMLRIFRRPVKFPGLGKLGRSLSTFPEHGKKHHPGHIPLQVPIGLEPVSNESKV